MSDIKREEIRKIIDELEKRVAEHKRVGLWSWWQTSLKGSKDDPTYHYGKAVAYRQSVRLLRDLLDRAPDSPDPGGLY